MHAVADCGLRGLGQQRLGIAQQRRLEGAPHSNSACPTAAGSWNPPPAICTIAWLGVEAPPMIRATPTTPSHPTTPVAAVGPLVGVEIKDTIAVVGKYRNAGAQSGS